MEAVLYDPSFMAVRVVIWIVIIVLVRALNIDLWFERGKEEPRQMRYLLHWYIIIICVSWEIGLFLG